MLSILIPTYNFVCVPLAAELGRQMQESDIEGEIVVMDDASTDAAAREANAAIASIEGCRYIELPQNTGIARIRNRLAEAARYDFFLFLDADVFPVTEYFLQNYIEASYMADVVCGGLLFRTPVATDTNRTLRYKYGTRVEAQTSRQRMQNPYGEFRTRNFLISREAFFKTRFDESFSRYGHEDTLFGKQLQLNGCTIAHIDNPIYHDVPDTNDEFLEKTRKSIDNLCEHRNTLQSHVRLLSLYERLHRLHLTGAVAGIYTVICPVVLANLRSKHPSLFLLNLYKAGYLCRVMPRNAQAHL